MGTVERTARGLGWRAFGLGIIALAVICLIWGGFDPGQPVPKDFPARSIFAVVVAIFMLAAGLGIEWRKTTSWAAAAITIYWTIFVVILMDGRSIMMQPGVFISYSNTAEQLAVATGALILYAMTANIDAAFAARLIRVGQIVFGICAVLFGGAHFFYMNFTAPLVPKWLPPNQLFWGYATGCFHILGGLAIIIGVRARLAAILLTVMYAGFEVLVWAPLLLSDLPNHGNWAETTENTVLIGVAWVVADSLTRSGRSTAPALA